MSGEQPRPSADTRMLLSEELDELFGQGAPENSIVTQPVNPSGTSTRISFGRHAHARSKKAKSFECLPTTAATSGSYVSVNENEPFRDAHVWCIVVVDLLRGGAVAVLPHFE